MVLFGSGGPPFSPIPVYLDGEETVHGIAVQSLIGVESDLGGSPPANFLLALFPGRTTWLLMAAPGPSPQVALAQVRQILSTVHRIPGRPSKPAFGSSDETWIGRWGVHGAALVITSDTSGVISARGSSTCSCLEQDALTLSLTADGSKMMAVVTEVTGFNPVTGSIVPLSTNLGTNATVGQRSFFEFMEPHLVIQVMLLPPGGVVPNQSSFGNPYWCGQGLDGRSTLDEKFTQACGA